MTPIAQNRLNSIVTEFEKYYGMDVTCLIEVLDRYINYYNFAENQKKELLCAYEDFDINSTSVGIENLMQTIRRNVELEERVSTAVANDMFDLSLLKKFISDLAIVFALNFPKQKDKQENSTNDINWLLDRSYNDNLYNEN